MGRDAANRMPWALKGGVCNTVNAKSNAYVLRQVTLQQAAAGLSRDIMQIGYHGVVLLQDLHVMNQLVLLLSYSLVMHSVKIPLLAKLVPCCRRLRQQAEHELLGACVPGLALMHALSSTSTKECVDGLCLAKACKVCEV